MTYSHFPRKHSILCVDDDLIGLALRTSLLESEGYVVTALSSPLIALEYDVSRFNLAVVDFDMPALNGFQLLLKLRAAHANFPIVLLSGTVGDLPNDMRIVFSRCLDKAAPVQHLLNVIHSYLTSAPDPLECRALISSPVEYRRHGL